MLGESECLREAHNSGALIGLIVKMPHLLQLWVEGINIGGKLLIKECFPFSLKNP